LSGPVSIFVAFDFLSFEFVSFFGFVNYNDLMHSFNVFEYVDMQCNNACTIACTSIKDAEQWRQVWSPGKKMTAVNSPVLVPTLNSSSLELPNWESKPGLS
jgi:hypothetical protein